MEQEKKTKRIDWEQRRYEIAKDCMVQLFTINMVQGNRGDWLFSTDLDESLTEQASYAIASVDSLITLLKENEN